MSGRRGPLSIPVVRIGFLLVILFVAGLLTRLPAWQFPQLFALHGVLAAPFFSALAFWHLEREGRFWELSAAVGIMAAILGTMSITMGLGFLLLALVSLGLSALPCFSRTSGNQFILASIFGALDYPCTLLSGIVLRSYEPTGAAGLEVVLLVIIAAGLSLLGALIVDKVLSHRDKI